MVQYVGNNLHYKKKDRWYQEKFPYRWIAPMFVSLLVFGFFIRSDGGKLIHGGGARGEPG